MMTDYFTVMLADEFKRQRMAAAASHRDRRMARRYRSVRRQRPGETCP